MRGSLNLKTRIKSWAESVGRWDEFVGIREELKSAGVKANDAWLRAAQRMDSGVWGIGEDLPRGRSDAEDQVEEGGGEVVEKAATKAVFGGKRVPTVKVVEWVASNMQVEDVGPGDAPSSEAWGMLLWARRSPVNESQFWGTIYAKLLPSRSQIEAEQRYTEDGSRVEEMASRLLAIKERSEV
jgi:hypothetical protein